MLNTTPSSNFPTYLKAHESLKLTKSTVPKLLSVNHPRYHTEKTPFKITLHLIFPNISTLLDNTPPLRWHYHHINDLSIWISSYVFTRRRFSSRRFGASSITVAGESICSTVAKTCANTGVSSEKIVATAS
jgi:hypothetical protein